MPSPEFLPFLGFLQNDPDRLFEPLRDALQGGQSNVSFPPLDEAILRAVHFDVIRKSLLAQLGTLPMASDDLGNAHLQPDAGDFHPTTLTVACFKSYAYVQ